MTKLMSKSILAIKVRQVKKRDIPSVPSCNHVPGGRGCCVAVPHTTVNNAPHRRRSTCFTARTVNK